MCGVWGNVKWKLKQDVANQKPEKKQKWHIKTMVQKKGESFVWTDNDVEFLLYITLEYKVNKTQGNVIWRLSASS